MFVQTWIEAILNGTFYLYWVGLTAILPGAVQTQCEIGCFEPVFPYTHSKNAVQTQPRLPKKDQNWITKVLSHKKTLEFEHGNKELESTPGCSLMFLSVPKRQPVFSIIFGPSRPAKKVGFSLKCHQPLRALRAMWCYPLFCLGQTHLILLQIPCLSRCGWLKTTKNRHEMVRSPL